MVRSYRPLSIFVLFAFSLVSCTQISRQPVSTMTIDTGATLTYWLSRPTAESTDGVLSLSIEEGVSMCYQPGQSITIKLIFQNLASEPLILQSRFLVVPDWSIQGDIRVDFFTTDNILIYTPAGNINEWSLPPAKFLSIPGNSEVEKVIWFAFPNTLMGNTDTPQSQVTPTPGEYLMRITYANYEGQTSHAWIGSVTSAPLKICIK